MVACCDYGSDILKASPCALRSDTTRKAAVISIRFYRQ